MKITLKKKFKEDANASKFFIVSSASQIKQLPLGKEQVKYLVSTFDEKKGFAELAEMSSLTVVFKSDGTTGKDLEKIRKQAAAFLDVCNKNKVTGVSVINNSGKAECGIAAAEAISLANYQFLKYKTKQEANTVSEIHLYDEEMNEDDLNLLEASCRYVSIARNWVNEPFSFLNSVQFAKELQKVGKQSGIKVEVLNKTRIEALKMGGLLAVNQGSIIPPTFTIMEYKPKKAVNKKPIVLVGKGVVYDTGGLSLKPTPNSMDYMKCDMGGAAVVGAAICAAAEAELPLHIVCLIPSTDNWPGERAYAPGDVVKMYSGKTVEVLNTDAEGRMILADALAYAAKYDPELVMDFATLTGAAAIAIGQYGLVCMGNAGQDVKQDLKTAGDSVHERLVEFPLWDEYGELIKSDVADIKNLGGPAAGAITAGKFLEHFTSYPWMHFDIAGSAFLHTKDSYRGKGGTGTGVRMLLRYFENRCK